MGPLEHLIHHLSIQLHLDPPLQLDHEGRCKILVEDTFTVQLETDISGDYCLVVAEVTSLSPGKFRENVFKSALRANALPHRQLRLAWLEQKQQLILFEKWPLRYITKEKSLGQFNALIQEAQTWRKNIETGISFPTELFPSSNRLAP